MRMLKIILITIIISYIFIPISYYWYNKIYGKDITDCMIQYINNYYPNWCSYIIFWKDPHIDKCGIENEFMVVEKKINWCDIDFFNTPYCYITLFFENILW